MIPLLFVARPIFQRMGVFNYPGGIPSSMSQESDQQWDFPNGWSPNNHMIIEGLRKSANPEMQDKVSFRVPRVIEKKKTLVVSSVIELLVSWARANNWRGERAGTHRSSRVVVTRALWSGKGRVG